MTDGFHFDLKRALVDEKVLPQEVIEEALKEQASTRDPILEVIIRIGKFDEKAFTHFLCTHYGYTTINPAVFVIDSALSGLISKNLAEKFLVMPISRFENTLTVAFANPTNVKAIDELRAVTGLRIKPVIASVGILKQFIAKYYGEGAPGEAVLGGEQLDDIVKMIESDGQGTNQSAKAEDLMKVAFDTPVIKLVNMIVAESIKRRASDIFIEPWEQFVRVRARVDGLLEEIVRPQKTLASALVSRIKVMSELDIAEHRVPQDGRFKVRIHEREVDLRVSILPTCFGEKVCLRVLDTKAQSHDIAKLGFNEQEQQIIKDCARHPHGMLLVTGPTGSGKTTTLYSVLKYLAAPEVNITTVEDPVEYQLPGINQVHVKEPIGLTFPAALRSILRQDPDIILIGEIRDQITLDIAVKAAMTGHLVLSTLHTNDAASSITRMTNMGLEPFLIASTVLMISAQRLVRRLCNRCRVPYELDKEVLKQLHLDPEKEHTFFKGKGCAQCRQSGYSGRSVITEILQMTPDILELVMHQASTDELKAVAHRQGMTTLRECAVRKALAGETSLEEVFRVTTEDQTASREQHKEDTKEGTLRRANAA